MLLHRCLMNKKAFLIPFLAVIFLLVLVNVQFISAGLCKSSSGYYEECGSSYYYKTDDYGRKYKVYYGSDDYSGRSNRYYKEDRYRDDSYEYHEEKKEEIIKKHVDAGEELGYYKGFYETYRHFEDKNWEYYDVGYYSGNEAGKYKGLYEGFKDGLYTGKSLGYDAGKYKGLYEGYKDGSEKWYNKGYNAGNEAGESKGDGGYYTSMYSRSVYSPGYWRYGAYSGRSYITTTRSENVRSSGRDYNDYYYKPKFDSEKGYYNMRY